MEFTTEKNPEHGDVRMQHLHLKSGDLGIRSRCETPEKCDSIGIYPLVMTNSWLENGHRNREFAHKQSW